MNVLSKSVTMWAEFKDMAEFEAWLDEQKPLRVAVLLAHEDKDMVTAHVVMEVKGYPMYVRDA